MPGLTQNPSVVTGWMCFRPHPLYHNLTVHQIKPKYLHASVTSFTVDLLHSLADLLFLHTAFLPPDLQTRVDYNNMVRCVSSTVGWPSEPVGFVHCSLSPNACYYSIMLCNWLWVAHFYSMFASCVEELQSEVCSHCHLQTPSGVDAFNWTDLV